MINRYLKHGLFGVSYQSNHMSGVKKPVYDTHDLLPPMLARSFRDLRFGFRGPFLVEILFRGASATYFSKVLIG